MKDTIARARRSFTQWWIVSTVCLWLVISSSPPAQCQSHRIGRETSLAPGWSGQSRFLLQKRAAVEQNNAKWLRISKRDSRKLSSHEKNSRGKKGQTYRNLSPSERNKLKDNYKQWESLSPEKRQELRRRMKKWKGLSSEERRLFRERYKQWQEISPEERQIIRKKLEKWDSLTPQEREKIQQRFRNR